MALDLAKVREHVETGLVDAALTRIMDDAVAEVEARFGTDADITQTFSPWRGQELLSLRRPAASITSVERLLSDYTADELVTGYELLFGGRTLKLHAGGWGRIVQVVYTPVPEASLRDRVALDLIRLQTQYEGVASQRVGDYRMSSFEYTRERERILQGISHRRGFRFA